jgi:hypothetical protein
MSKNIKRNIKDQKEGTVIALKEVEDSLERYRLKRKEIVDFEIKYFIISLSILLSTNIYIHKTVFIF